MNTKELPFSAKALAVANLICTSTLGTYYLAQLCLALLFGGISASASTSSEDVMKFVALTAVKAFPLLLFALQGIGSVLLLLRKEIGRKILLGLSLLLIISAVVSSVYFGMALLLSSRSALVGALPLMLMGVFWLIQAILFLSVPTLNLLILTRKQVKAALS